MFNGAPSDAPLDVILGRIDDHRGADGQCFDDAGRR